MHTCDFLMWRPCQVTMGRIISFGWMQIWMWIKDEEFYFSFSLLYMSNLIYTRVYEQASTYIVRIKYVQAHSRTTIFFSSIYCLEMGVMLCLFELSSTIPSHIGLTSNTSDKPIVFLSTESSPCPKITLLSLGSQQSRMVSRGVDSSLWHLQYAQKKQIKPFCKSWFLVISKIYRACVACHLVLYSI